MKLLWVGSPFFFNALKTCGWDATLYNFEDVRVLDWNNILELANGKPDVLVVADKSRAPFVLGVEQFPCLTVFYSVDSHIHSWQNHYAQAFDICLMSLRDHMARFLGMGIKNERLWWSPAFAPSKAVPPLNLPPKQWSTLFVGNVTENTPKRATFFKALQQKTNLHIQFGNYVQLFPQAEILINHCEHGDLNFRVFEAMGCAGCLLTPRIQHGLLDLFEDGIHLTTYEFDNVDDAYQKIQFLLANPDIMAKIRENALTEINAKHRDLHRAQTFTDNIQPLLANAKSLMEVRQAKAEKILSQCLKFVYLLWAEEYATVPLYRKAYLYAAQGLNPHDGSKINLSPLA